VFADVPVKLQRLLLQFMLDEIPVVPVNFMWLLNEPSPLCCRQSQS